MTADLSDWAEETSHLPIAFAQVREDAEIDLEILSSIPSPISGVVIASGGCTVAALLSSSDISKLYVVDPNPAQIVLTKLKLEMLSTLNLVERLALLGHTTMEISSRISWVEETCQRLGLDANLLGPQNLWAEKGLDYSGRYEIVFEKIRAILNPFHGEIEQMFSSSDSVAPSKIYFDQLEQAFDKVMSQDHLVTIFGEQATANRVQDFSQHFFKRTQTAFEIMPCFHNPYLAQVLLGKYMNQKYPSWLNRQRKNKNSSIEYICQPMTKALSLVKDKVDFVHLSNILDWLSVEEAEQTLGLAHSVLPSGGRVIIRQLNSSIDIPKLNSLFDWDIKTSKSLQKKDRSYFYRNIYLGYKK